VHAWCLMSNHYHLLIQTPDANLVEGMKWLQSTFAGAKCLASGAASNGDVELVSSRVSRYRRESVSSDDEWNTLKVLECVDWCFL
jgi:hypothetical protein